MVTCDVGVLSDDQNTAQGLGVSHLLVTRKHVCNISCNQKSEKHFWLRLNELYLQQIWSGGVDWINLAQNKGHMAECFDEGDEHLGSVKFGENIWLPEEL